MSHSNIDIAIIGGAGHVGLPLALAFAHKGKNVLIMDVNEAALASLKAGNLPYTEKNGEEYLAQALAENRLFFSSDPASIKNIEHIILTIGTPVDEFLNPATHLIRHCIDDLSPYLAEKTLLVLRSTVFPGITEWLSKYLTNKGINIDIAFCPERVVQGKGIEEVFSMPQIISGMTPTALLRAKNLFELLAPEVISLSTKEAEFAKLFTNAYRYINFAIANQFYMLSDQAGLNYNKIHAAMTHNYPRMSDMPKPGFTAGPCLFKDTMQLSAFAKNEFNLGHAAMLVNEGLPLYLISRLQHKYGDSLEQKTIGLLGMAFKNEVDDIRSSLSYKLKKHLSIIVHKVLTTDPYVKVDPTLQPLEEVVAQSDILIVCTPHLPYKGLKSSGKEVIDIWDVFYE